jgi:hypothetical protein
MKMDAHSTMKYSEPDYSGIRLISGNALNGRVSALLRRLRIASFAFLPCSKLLEDGKFAT